MLFVITSTVVFAHSPAGPEKKRLRQAEMMEF